MNLLITILLVSVAVLSGSQSAKILMLPIAVNSHVFYFLEIGEELIKQGHEIYMVLSPRFPKPQKLNNTTIHLIHYNATEPEFFDVPNHEEMEVEFIEMMTGLGDRFDFISTSRYFSELITTTCTNCLGDEAMFKKLKNMKFDFGLIDGFVLNRCMYALAYKLGIPYGTLMTMYEPWLSRIPALPSFVPFMLRTSYSEKMNFWQRLYNVYCIVDFYAWPRITTADDSYVSTYVPEKPIRTLNYLAGQSQIWLINTHVAIDYPQPMMPNVIPVGGLTTRATKPLPADLEKFIKDAEHGFIVVSFGSILKVFPEHLLKKLVTAFAQVKQKVIFRLEKVEQVENPPSNVLIRKWIPQNDLLGHPKVRLFITHCGNNGQFEALSHGTPMIGFPIFGEQHYNAQRMAYKGYGLVMYMAKFTPDELVRNVNRVIEDKTFKDNIALGREIFLSDDMTPKDRALYWINHVLEFGGDHLHSYALEMPWYEYLMLDILLFICLCAFLVVYTLFCVLSFVRRLSFVSASPQSKLKAQ